LFNWLTREAAIFNVTRAARRLASTRVRGVFFSVKVAAAKPAHIELHIGVEAPFERHLVDGHRARGGLGIARTSRLFS
jgi:hypothetical protein